MDVTPILFHIKGLRHLAILMGSPEATTEETDEQRQGMADGIAFQMGTLVDLVLNETLYRLGLRLASRSHLPNDCQLIRVLPHLKYFWIADLFGHCGDIAEDEADRIKGTIPSSSRLRFFAFADIQYVRRERHPEYYETTQPNPESEFVAIATGMTWKTALAPFYGE